MLNNLNLNRIPDVFHFNRKYVQRQKTTESFLISCGWKFGFIYHFRNAAPVSEPVTLVLGKCQQEPVAARPPTPRSPWEENIPVQFTDSWKFRRLNSVIKSAESWWNWKVIDKFLIQVSLEKSGGMKISAYGLRIRMEFSLLNRWSSCEGKDKVSRSLGWSSCPVSPWPRFWIIEYAMCASGCRPRICANNVD